VDKDKEPDTIALNTELNSVHTNDFQEYKSQLDTLDELKLPGEISIIPSLSGGKTQKGRETVTAEYTAMDSAPIDYRSTPDRMRSRMDSTPGEHARRPGFTPAEFASRLDSSPNKGSVVTLHDVSEEQNRNGRVHSTMNVIEDPVWNKF